MLISQPKKSPRALTLDPRTYDRALGCVHCGLCLPVCPTYVQTGNEADGPRGRIQLIRGMVEGAIEATPNVRRHLDLCLDCRACETACPSGVIYHELIEETRAKLHADETKPPADQLLRWLLFHVFVYPTRLKLALIPARIFQRLGIFDEPKESGILDRLPGGFRKLIQLLPAAGSWWPAALPAEVIPTRSGKSRLRIGFLSGCVGSVMFDDVNRQAVELLALGGATVITPRSQVCCGAIHHHDGDPESAKNFARRNIDAFLPVGGSAVDFISTTIAGCGAMLRDYPTMLRDDPEYAKRAVEFSSRVRDISEVLLEIDLPDPKFTVSESLTYHDACHLVHGQKVSAAPRIILSRIPGLKLIPLPESDMCCGAAGTYHLTQPEMAGKLATRKLENIRRTQTEICVSGNIGCTMHLSAAATEAGYSIQFVHLVQIMHRAQFGPFVKLGK